MEIPRCPDHAGGGVVRAGWYGKAPHRRQRWLCRPGNGDRPHRFCEVLPRQATSEHFCVECSTRLERWEGQAGARRYLFSAREVGYALSLVAGGESYRGAAQVARLAAGRTRGGLTGRRGRRRDPNLDGQLVANWVDALAPIVCAGQLAAAWPRWLALDSREFRIDRGPRAGESFHVFAAVGHDEPARPSVWRMAAFPRRTQQDWEQFLLALDGTPELVITDADKALRNALQSVFPRAHDEPPRMHRCELHLRRSLENVLAPLTDSPDHPLLRAAPQAFYSPDHWARFETDARASHRRGDPPLPALIRWLDTNAADLARQLASRTAGPRSTGAVESALRNVEGAFLGRSQSFGNRPRLNHLLDLMTLHANGRSDPRTFADHLRERLHPAGGIAPDQRPHDDPKCTPSLLA
jgi:hypothetical protein